MRTKAELFDALVKEFTNAINRLQDVDINSTAYDLCGCRFAEPEALCSGHALLEELEQVASANGLIKVIDKADGF